MTLSADDIEMTLDAAGLPWTRRGDHWVVPAAEVARELHVMLTDSGVRIDAVLVEWDEAPAESLKALARFLEAGGRDVAGVRGSLEGRQATLTAEVAADHIERHLGEAVRAV